LLSYDKLPQRFKDRIDKTDSCWLWTRPLNGHGYAQLKYQGVWYRAHTYVYEALVGVISDGLQLDHLCRVRHCVNPEHLEPVTSRENTLRGEGITAKLARRDSCNHGHKFTSENVYVGTDGYRRCRTCRSNQRRNRSRTKSTAV